MGAWGFLELLAIGFSVAKCAGQGDIPLSIDHFRALAQTWTQVQPGLDKNPEVPPDCPAHEYMAGYRYDEIPPDLSPGLRPCFHFYLDEKTAAQEKPTFKTEKLEPPEMVSSCRLAGAAKKRAAFLDALDKSDNKLASQACQAATDFGREVATEQARASNIPPDTTLCTQAKQRIHQIVFSSPDLTVLKDTFKPTKAGDYVLNPNGVLRRAAGTDDEAYALDPEEHRLDAATMEKLYKEPVKAVFTSTLAFRLCAAEGYTLQKEHAVRSRAQGTKRESARTEKPVEQAPPTSPSTRGTGPAQK